MAVGRCLCRSGISLPMKLAFLLICMLTAAWANQVRVPERVSAVLGKNVTLGCRVEVSSNLSLTQSSWERRLPSGSITLAVFNPQFGTSVAPSYAKRLAFHSPSSHDATITLADVGFADVGTYTCKVATFPLGNTQASTHIGVMVEPKVYVSAGSAPLLDGGNETVVGTCTAERALPQAEVSWESNLFGRSQVHLQAEANGTTTTQVRYAWHPTRHAQGQSLTCVVRHPALQTEFRIPYQINVQFAPDVTVVGYDGDWFIGQENAQLQCRANANPTVHSYKWTRLDQELPGDVYVVNNTLVFSHPLRSNDSGVYRCEAGNGIGRRSRDTRIRVQDPAEKQLTSPMMVAGAVIGAVLALFLITVFTIVLLSSRKALPPVYMDKVIDLPPTHKPPPPYSERPPLTQVTSDPAQLHRVNRQSRMTDKAMSETGVLQETMFVRGAQRQARSATGAQRQAASVKGALLEAMPGMGAQRQAVSARGALQEAMFVKGAQRQATFATGAQRQAASTKGALLEAMPGMGAQRQAVSARGALQEAASVRGTQRQINRVPTCEPLSYQEWVCHQDGADRVYINHREHYV